MRLGIVNDTPKIAALFLGAIFGIGAVNGKRGWRAIGQSLLAWVATLPLGLSLGAGL